MVDDGRIKTVNGKVFHWKGVDSYQEDFSPIRVICGWICQTCGEQVDSWNMKTHKCKQYNIDHKDDWLKW